MKEKLQTSGPIPFSHFMEMALYHATSGYYSTEKQKTGKQGDFITSVSIGPCFGTILARRLHNYWLEIGQPPSFQIIEPGAHDGTLAQDILNAIKLLSEPFYQAAHYHLIEPSLFLQQKQKTKLAQYHQKKYTSHVSMEPLQSLQGAIISNELIDAFPVELIQLNKGQWHQQYVSLDEHNQFIFTNTSIHSTELKNFCQNLGTAFPENYTTEYNTGITSFVESASKTLQSGLFLTIDYGFQQNDYYHPDRTTGTLQTFHAHQKAENPLRTPGEIDITAHVDFTRLEHTAQSHGFHTPWFGTQASYLTQHARKWLLEMETKPDPHNHELIRQFQTLTHPSMLGTRFSVLEMHK